MNVVHFQRVPERRNNLCILAIASCFITTRPAAAEECPAPGSEIATDRPDVTNSSLVVPAGSLQLENGINGTGTGVGTTFDGSNSRLRFGIAPCLEILADIPTYTGKLGGTPDTGFSDFTPAIKYQFSSLPEHWTLSLTAGAGLPTGSIAVAGFGIQPYLQLPWSHELGDGWATNGMFTQFFAPADPVNRFTTEATFSVEKRVTSRADVFVEYVGDYRAVGANSQLINVGGGYLLTDTQQIDAHLAIGLNRNSPNYIVGVGYSVRFDNVFRALTGAVH
jgi:Putative MetA-pathway of phenol degradation